MKRFYDLFENIISLDNLFSAWDEFKKEKMGKPDVQNFYYQMEENVFGLHYDLKNKTYKHSPYSSFYISDPK